LPVGTPSQPRRTTSREFTNGHSGDSHTAPQPVGAAVAAGAGWHVEASLGLADPEPARTLEKTLLVVEDDPYQRQHIVDLMASLDVHTIAVGSGEEAVALLEDQHFSCVVLDLGLPGLSGWQVIDHMKSRKALRSIPLLVYTARDLTKKEELKLGRATKTIVIKEVRSPERLKDEVTAIFEAGPLSTESRSNAAEPNDVALAGKKVLIVDDDIRNIYALTALLERQQMEVIAVDSGQEALDALAARNDFVLALVDVMMPEMDGYETIRKMRDMASFGDRPIIAVTAKAMKGDREKCIEAGASDYIAKPVNTGELLSMLKSWLTA
jgi:CheY-like chemotaxis protein